VTKKPLMKILLVEDDPDIQEVTALMLSGIGEFEVKSCGSAAEALECVEAFAPDLILLDVMMPDLDGPGAFAAFGRNRATAKTPVIFMTARVQPSEVAEYRKLGCLGVIPKPFDPDTLSETIQGMWDRHQAARMKEARREELEALRRQYAAELPAKIRALALTAASLGERWDAETAADARDMAHRLAGSAAIYGFPGVSEAARRVVDRIDDENAASTPSGARPLLELVAALEKSLARDEPSGPRGAEEQL